MLPLPKVQPVDDLHAIRKAGGAVIAVDLHQRGQLAVGGVLHAQGLHRRHPGAQAQRHGRAFVPVQRQTNLVNFIIAIHVENLLVHFRSLSH